MPGALAAGLAEPWELGTEAAALAAEAAGAAQAGASGAGRGRGSAESWAGLGLGARRGRQRRCCYCCCSSLGPRLPPPATARRAVSPHRPKAPSEARAGGRGSGGGEVAGRIVTHGGAPVRSPGAAM